VVDKVLVALVAGPAERRQLVDERQLLGLAVVREMERVIVIVLEKRVENCLLVTARRRTLQSRWV